MKKELVTVIVPVYNVEDFLVQSVNSILNQTYKNLEIILIDDGSTDSSSSICDSFADNYKNVQVFHRKNVGLAGSRNYGIDKSHGSVLLFVDSDDYLESELIEKCMIQFENTNSNMVTFDFKPFGKIEGQSRIVNPKFPNIPISGNDALELLLEGKIGTYAWTNMYKSELFQKIRFPIGRNMEDLATIYKLLYCTDIVSYVPEKLYNYRQRSNSITHSFNLENLNSYLIFNEEFEGFFQTKPTDLQNKAAAFKVQKLLMALQIAYYINDFKNYRFIKTSIFSAYDNSNKKYFTKTQKFKLLLIKLNLWQLFLIWKRLKRK